MLEFNKYFAKIAFNLHFAPQRKIVSAIIMLFIFSVVDAQEPAKADSLRQRPFSPGDTLSVPLLPAGKDTITPAGRKISKDAIDKDIVYTAEENIRTNLINKKVILTKNAKVTYGDIELTADSIVLEMETGSVYATGRPDSTGKLAGKPVFKEGSQVIESKELTYNFKSKKAWVKGSKTEQDGGYLSSATSKLNADGTIFVDDSKYSTCDKEIPDFYIALRRAKFYPGEKIVSGPANLVVADIPLPLIIPYGFFPIQSKRASGLIFPNFGQEASRGYYMTDGGFYLALSDYYDLKFTGSVYTNGTWLGAVATTYRMRYRFSGNFSFSYASNVNGYKGMDDYGKTSNYKISWSHSQDAKANPSSRFSASVNMTSSGFDKNNSYSINDLNTTTRQSSISYSKSWTGTPINFATSFNQSQNTKTNVVTMSLPKATLTVSRIYPFKPKNPIKSKWYHDIQMQYTANIENRINTYDSILFSNKVWDDMTNGFKHDIPISIPVKFKRLNNFTVSPSLRYSGVFYTQRTLKYWDPDYYDEETNDTVPSVVDRIEKGLFYGHAIVPSFSASFTPSITGNFRFTNPESKLRQIHHVIKPSVGFSYTPAFSGLSSDMYRTVISGVNKVYDENDPDVLIRIDTTYATYSIYEDNIYGTPSLSTRSGSVSFSLVNILEAKVFSEKDTTGKDKKIKLLDNFSASTNYNIFADSCHWSPISARMSTTILQNLNVSLSSTFNMYAISNKGKQIRKFAFSEGQGLARMTSLTLSLDFDLAKLISGNDKSKDTQNKGGSSQLQGMQGSSTEAPQDNTFDEFGYVDFSMPWSARVRYSFNYSKSGLKATKTNGLTFSGDVKVTPKIALTYSSGYDFVDKKLSNSSIGINRDLHCWQMSFTWVPVGPFRSWNFTVRPKSGILQDLKYERKRDYHETY